MNPRSTPPLLGFDGSVELSGNELIVTSVQDEVYLTVSVSEPSVHVQVWVNDKDEPDQITIVIDG